ncbi:MAG: SufD family Fe-S cluster assembly protein [Pirellulaceae bacterium]
MRLHEADGYQRNDNLLLSDHVRADSIPGLEIFSRRRAVHHGSTSGKVDEELIFYAQSRGFTRKEAGTDDRHWLFQQIFDRISIESVRGTRTVHRSSSSGSTAKPMSVSSKWPTADIPASGKLSIEVGDRFLVIVRVDGQIYCLDDVCTHDGGATGRYGELDGFCIACPRHGAQFDVRDGRALTMPPNPPAATLYALTTMPSWSAR